MIPIRFMPLSAGTRLGPYEIVAPLGAGGMGEVYKARDTRLDRTVAIKILPERLAPTPEARQRFEREARTISQLSHPHICALHDVGREGGVEYLVMEYLEGDTLAERLTKGPLPLDSALRYGADIADALDKAHRQGIVHRDLKPGNVMLTKSGVKLLDFGLAKAFSTPPSSGHVLTALPTVAGNPDLTQEGAILGTVQYMAPEQLEGKITDARTDIFALGCLLYEMCTGKKAFSGSSQASLISSIMKEEPAPISTLLPMSPPALDRVVKTCLAKDPEDRWQTARDVALQLQGIRDDGSSSRAAVLAPERRSRLAILPWAVAAAGVALAAFGLMRASRPAPRRPMLRTFLTPPPKTVFYVVGANVGGLALSPDGRRLAFGVRAADGSYRLWVREMDGLEPYPVPGAEEAVFPFWSPDSRWIGFFAKGKVKVIQASPAPPPPRDLADAVEARGGAWGEDGTILYAPQNFGYLMRVPAAGGKPVPATQLDRAAGETSHRWPEFLPGGRRFLYQIRKPDPKAPLEVSDAIFVGSLDGSEKREVISKDMGASRAVYAVPGYLLFRRGTNLMAIAFDRQSLTTSGEPALLVPNIQGFLATGASVFSVAADLLVYSERVAASQSKLVLLDRSGRELSTVIPLGLPLHVGLSSDGQTVATAKSEEPLPPDLWLFDTGVGRGLRLTRDSVPQLAPVFAPDGRRIFYSAFSSGPWDIWEMALPGGKDARPFIQSPSTKTANDVSPDGRYLLYREFNPGTRGDLKYVPLTGEDRQPRTFVATADEESNGDFSPDGRWVAYTSDESGRKEVYAAAFPDPTRRFRVSSDGGQQPRWSRDGKELFYLRSDQVMAAPVGRQDDQLVVGESRALFRVPIFSRIDPGFDAVTPYDVMPDGRFLMLLSGTDETAPPLVVVQNWAEMLRKP